VGDAGSLHLESLERPVAGRDRADEAGGDEVAVHPERLERVELGRSVRLLEDLIDVKLEVGVELLEKVLKQK
jgi:hypothetical protein